MSFSNLKGPGCLLPCDESGSCLRIDVDRSTDLAVAVISGNVEGGARLRAASGTGEPASQVSLAQAAGRLSSGRLPPVAPRTSLSGTPKAAEGETIPMDSLGKESLQSNEMLKNPTPTLTWAFLLLSILTCAGSVRQAIAMTLAMGTGSQKLRLPQESYTLLTG